MDAFRGCGRCDGAGENDCAAMKQVAIEERFVLDITSPDTPEEDGGAEKGIGDVTRAGRCLEHGSRIREHGVQTPTNHSGALGL